MTTEAERERRLLARIPGGAQLLSKRPEQFAPGQWPRHYSRAKGAHTWDLAGRRFLDMSTSGIGTCVLGFADDDVDDAVRRAIANGSMSTLNCVEEWELADLLCELHPWADMVRYARSGGEALVIAVRLARAATARTTVAFCGYHGWHDWYLAANLGGDDHLDGHLLPGLDPAGVPAALAGTALPFRYNRLDELEAIIAEHGDLAAIVMEPVREHDPEPGFLPGVAELARRTGAVLIFDEVTSGLRVTTGGAHLELGVDPDLAVFAKALGNGYPMAAVVGRGSVMEYAQRSFVSSTYWTERLGPTAALATLRKHRDREVGRHLVAIGSAVQAGWREAADAAGVAVAVHGIAPLSHLRFVEQPQPSITLFTQFMLDRGILAGGSFYPSFAHRDEDVSTYLDAVGGAFVAVRAAQDAGDVTAALRGPVAHTGFTRLT
ncbi:aminotransferase class III-fold pyridoxal phosphate-dependent enzyme [Luedemannella helvata]|uniref:Aminotransferase class III-fold pyridoxal phosphate-dependent enzyme n=1 Tax=Luedemannella helvata TaxID=349315 RepID=A0ABN2JSZ0_9ACTN